MNVYSNQQDYRYQKEFKVQRLSIEEGLSQSVVSEIIQDSNGYIWLATEDGLNRFDSYEFKIFRHDHKINSSLHENWVISLVEETDYGIWIGTVSGLSFYNPKNEKFTNYALINPELKNIIHDLVYSKNSIVWIASNDGLFYFNRNDDKKILPYRSPTGEIIDSTIKSIAESNNYIYAAGKNCIYKIKKSNWELSNLCEKNAFEKIKNIPISNIKIDKNILWIGSKKGLIKYNITSNEVSYFSHQKNDQQSLSNNSIQDLVVDKNGFLWVATANGLNKFNKNKNKFERYIEKSFSKEGLSGNDIYSLFVDDQNLIWLGTYGAGVNLLDPNQHQFEHLLSRTDTISIGSNNTIHGIEKDRFQNLWLASYGGGLINYNLLTGKISRPLNEHNITYGETVYSLLIDLDERLWIASLSELNLVNTIDKKIINTVFYIDNQKVDKIEDVNKIHEDHNGTIWLCTDKGLLKVISINKNNEELTVKLTDFTHKFPHGFKAISTNVSTIIDDQNGDFWIGGYAGLLLYKVKLDEWHHFQYDQNNSQSISNNIVQVIYEDSLGFLWIGTADGLNRLNRASINNNNFHFKRITTYEGLPNNSIYGILEDKNNDLWFSTTLGLVKFSKNKEAMELFRRVDGLSSDEFNTGAYFSDSTGRLYFGSINGITIVNDVKDLPANQDRSILFTNVRSGSREISVYQLNHSDSPTIIQEDDEPSIDITFIYINYEKLGTQLYRSRIVEINQDWNYLGTRNNLIVAGLSEGSYVLEIESKRSGGNWLGVAKNLNIIVKTNFWNSSNAYYLLSIIMVMFFIFILFYSAFHYKRKINKVDKKMNIERLRLKKLRFDNDALKVELTLHENEMSDLSEKIKLNEQLLDVEKYRDPVTGFYRLNYLSNIEDESITSFNGIAGLTNYSYYKMVAVIELNDYINNYTNFGPLAAAELSAKVSIYIRQKVSSDNQIFCVQNGMFLILSNEENENLFRDSIINLRHKIIRSQFEVSNGLFTKTKVSLTMIDITKSDITKKDELLKITDLITQLHHQNTKDKKQSSIEISLNVPISTISNIEYDFFEMQKNGQLHIVEMIT